MHRTLGTAAGTLQTGNGPERAFQKKNFPRRVKMIIKPSQTSQKKNGQNNKKSFNRIRNLNC